MEHTVDISNTNVDVQNAFSGIEFTLMGEYSNGKENGLKIRRPQAIEGSTPSLPTINECDHGV